MKSIPNLEMPPASTPGPKAEASGDKQELSGKGQPTAGLTEMCRLPGLGSEFITHISSCALTGPCIWRISMAQQAVIAPKPDNLSSCSSRRENELLSSDLYVQTVDNTTTHMHNAISPQKKFLEEVKMQGAIILQSWLFSSGPWREFLTHLITIRP